MIFSHDWVSIASNKLTLALQNDLGADSTNAVNVARVVRRLREHGIKAAWYTENDVP